MTKRIISLLLLAAILVAACAPAFADVGYRYVKTDNGKRLNVREKPKTSSKLVARAEYGEYLYVYSISNGWAEVNYGGAFGFVQSRYLSKTQPAEPKPASSTKKSTSNTKKEKTDEQKALEELNKELKTLKSLETPLTLTVRPSRSSGWVNFRVGPGTGASRIATLIDGKQLTAIGETNKWYQATDPETGNTGFISKTYVSAEAPAPVFTFAKGDQKESLGVLNVNGEFALQCKVPDGYTVQVVNMMGTKLIASINPTEFGKPVLYLSIAMDDMYADVERLNDLSAEEKALLEQTFTDMNDVEITYRQTAYGTDLIVTREIGADTDFVDFLSIYKGYLIEFVMTPNPKAASQTLTEEQIKMCIDFLSELDFVPVQ